MNLRLLNKKNTAVTEFLCDVILDEEEDDNEAMENEEEVVSEDNDDEAMGNEDEAVNLLDRASTDLEVFEESDTLETAHEWIWTFRLHCHDQDVCVQSFVQFELAQSHQEVLSIVCPFALFWKGDVLSHLECF